MAIDLRAPTGRDTDVASAFAAGYQRSLQASAYEGCLRGAGVGAVTDRQIGERPPHPRRWAESIPISGTTAARKASDDRDPAAVA